MFKKLHTKPFLVCIVIGLLLAIWQYNYARDVPSERGEVPVCSQRTQDGACYTGEVNCPAFDAGFAPGCPDMQLSSTYRGLPFAVPIDRFHSDNKFRSIKLFANAALSLLAPFGAYIAYEKKQV